MFCASLLAACGPGHAEGLKVDAAADGADVGVQAPFWRVYFSPYTYHWQYNPQHRPVWAIGAERQRPDGWLLGGSYFRNSFGQPSAYLYVGKRIEEPFGQAHLFVQLSGGLLYGYRGQFANKVPFNHDGYSPGAVLAIGWHQGAHSEFSVDVLGASALMFEYAYILR